jgi:hypothetical protein
MISVGYISLPPPLPLGGEFSFRHYIIEELGKNTSKYRESMQFLFKKPAFRFLGQRLRW